MRIIPPGSLDDFFEQERKAQEQANARVQPWQAQIQPGDYFKRWHNAGFNIYGQVLEDEEPRHPSLQYYRLCRAYSLSCPKGEMGDIHVAQIANLLSEEQFREARDTGWP